MNPIIKVCGMRDAENIDKVLQLKPDWMGFIFFEKSPRNIIDINLQHLFNVKKVGVFVNASLSFIQNKVEKHQLALVQLHGDESPEFCGYVSKFVPVMKAISIAVASDFENLAAYEKHVEYFLFDTKSDKARGGTGEKFDWNILSHYTGNIPFLLSGGIGPDDAEKLKQINHSKLIGFDLNSRFEISPAMKDATKLKQFIQQVKHTA